MQQSTNNFKDFDEDTAIYDLNSNEEDTKDEGLSNKNNALNDKLKAK
jgi:hypothetical protein